MIDHTEMLLVERVLNDIRRDFPISENKSLLFRERLDRMVSQRVHEVCDNVLEKYQLEFDEYDAEIYEALGKNEKV